MLIIALFSFQMEGHQEPCSKVGSLIPVKHLVGFYMYG